MKPCQATWDGDDSDDDYKDNSGDVNKRRSA